MEPHPIRVELTDEDDLKRWRLTVAFRWLLAIPHYFWFIGWTILVIFAAVLQWIVTLVSGRPWSPMSRFLGSYTRYITHLFSYLTLTADPYPPFSGRPGYIVDLEIEEPEDPRQSRVKTLFRLVLALPALLISGVLIGVPGPTGSSSSTYEPQPSGGYETTSGGGGTGAGIIFGVAVLAWFACLAVGRQPHGFRGLTLWGLRYNAQTCAYLFMLTSRYPNSDPFEPAPLAPETAQPVRIRIEDDLERSRLTVFFRLLLTIPHFIWLLLWGIAAFFAAVANWVATLVTGRSPEGLHNFLAAYLRYQTHVYAFLTLVANPFPGFTGEYGSYPIDLEIDPPARQHRLKTLFRGVLSIPAFLISFGFTVLLFLIAFLGWFASLATGRMPLGLRNVGAYVLRYNAQTNAYAAYLLTDRYPYTGPAERFGEPVEDEPGDEPEPYEPFPALAG